MPRQISAILIGVGFALVVGCGGALEEHAGNDTIHVTKAEMTRLRASVDEVTRLRAQLAKQAKRLQLVEQRAGVRPFRSTKIKPTGVGPVALTMPNASFVASLGANPKKLNLGKYLKAYDGYVVAYWATWCVPCTTDEELAHLRHLQKQLRRQNIELVSIAIDDIKAVLGDSRAPKWLYPFWHKQDGHLKMLPRALIQHVGVGLPLFLVVSKTGQIHYIHNSKLDDIAVRDLVTATASVCRL